MCAVSLAKDEGIQPIAAARPLADIQHELTREWLITNGQGGYASGTTINVPTRGYHGLLIASARPPLERWLLLANVLERVTVEGRTWELANFQFDGSFHPRGFEYLTGFAVSNRRPTPWVRFDYALGDVRLIKRVVMPRDHHAVHIRYQIQAAAGGRIALEVLPFVAMRDFHGRMRAFDGGFHVEPNVEGNLTAVDGHGGWPRLWMRVDRADTGPEATFQHEPDWWYGFTYREEAARGLGDREDLFVPGHFTATGVGSLDITLRAQADFTSGHQRPQREEEIVISEAPTQRQSVEDRLREAADAFVVKRITRGGDLTTILAGYHWFGDWGRDTFISLPGLLLETGRYAEAREVLQTFASVQKDGLIPNRFSDYGEGADYNSVDASLWYLHAAVAYCDGSGDEKTWKEILGPTCERIIDSFEKGTLFQIHMEPDGLIYCGDETIQLTWMDAKFGDIVFTPRFGKPVEINALWYHGLRAVAERAENYDLQRARRYHELADRAEKSFGPVFWNESRGCLYDVVRGDFRDASIRPNQIFAVSLPHSPLKDAQMRAVVERVERDLLTPMGLRSLAPSEPAYRGRYGGTPYERDSVYHQGTVWGWLIGPYVEACLRVYGSAESQKQRLRELLEPLIRHLDEAGIGSVSEIFDGDPPHTPRGCIAQAWSVGELLRAWRLTEPDPA